MSAASPAEEPAMRAAEEDGGVAAGQPGPERARVRRSWARWVTPLALLPTPIWFAIAALSDAGPAWRAEYHGGPDFAGPAVLVDERRLNLEWDRQQPNVPGGLDTSSFSARFDTCLKLSEPREIPFLLVATGLARFSIDGREQLRVEENRERGTRGKAIPLEAGSHHLSVEFSARGWPSIGLEASFDGRAPVAVPPEGSDPGVRWFQPRPGIEPCN